MTQPYQFNAFPQSAATDPATLRSLFQQALSQVLGSVLPGGLGQLAAGMAGPQILRGMGVYNDIMMDTPLTTGGMSPLGVANYTARSQSLMVASRSFERAQRQKEQEFWSHIVRLTNSEASYLREHQGAQHADYEAFVTNTAIGYSNGPASLLYKAMDPYEMGKAAPYMAMIGGNLSTRQFMMGDRMRPSAAREFVSNLFTDEKGNFAFNSAQYGGMGFGEVSMLTAALTKNMDPIRGTHSGELGNAARKFSDRVKEYAQALEPLKDVFGKDIPSMLRTVEELSGQSIGRMGVEQARSIATNITNGVMSGNYTIADVSGVNNKLVAQLTRLGMGDAVINQAAALGVDILDTGTNNPAFIRKDRFLQQTYDTMASAAASSGAEYMDRAYAMWKNRTGGSLEDFRKEFAGMSDPRDILRKGMELAGVNSFSELDRGLGYEGYREAKNARLGASIGAEAVYRDRIRVGLAAFRRTFAKDQNLSQGFAVLERAFAAGADIRDLDAVKNYADGVNEDSIRQAIWTVENSSGVASMGVGAQVYSAASQLSNQREALERNQKLNARRTLLNAIQGKDAPAGSVPDLIMRAVKSGSVEDIERAIAKNLFLDKDAIEDAHRIQKAFGTGDEGTEMQLYAASAEGISNKHFMEALRKGDAEEMRIAREMGHQNLDAYFKVKGATWNELKGVQTAEARKALLEDKHLRAQKGFNDLIKGINDIDSNKDRYISLREATELATRLRTGTGIAEDPNKADRLMSMVNAASDKIGRSPVAPGDIAGIMSMAEQFLPQLVTVLQKLSTLIDGKNTQAGNEPGAGAPRKVGP